MTVTLQPFKENDALEAMIRDCALPTLQELGLQRDAFYEGAYTAYPLGEILYDLVRDPMSGVITREIFTTSFFAIHGLFTRPGTFEFYMQVFRTIFGENVDVEFTVPAPGKLLINTSVLDTESFNILARRVEDGAYVYYNLVTSDGDLIVGLGAKGIKTQGEVNALMFEISVAGVWTVCTLSLS